MRQFIAAAVLFLAGCTSTPHIHNADCACFEEPIDCDDHHRSLACD